MLQRQIDATDAEIDAAVYELYGLTEEEIKVVERQGEHRMSNSDEIIANARVVVDGDLSITKLRKLIALSAEEERLDYKTGYNLSGDRATKDKVEMVRDVVALANTYGGYIVLGIRENKDQDLRYIPEGLDEEILSSLDIDILRAQIERYISERTEVQLQVHRLPEFGSKSFALIYIPPSKDSPIILERNGEFQDSQSQPSKRVFSAGDILIRKGASSQRVDQSDMRRIVSRIRLREKDKWTEEILGMRDLVQRLDTLITLLSGGTIPAVHATRTSVAYDEANLFLAPAAFQEHIVGLLEQQQLITIKRYLQSVPEAFSRHVGDIPAGDNGRFLEVRDNRLLPVFDNLTVLGIVFVEYGEWDLLAEVQRVFYQLCKQANIFKFPSLSDTSLHFGPTWVWYEVITRIYILGGLLVHRGYFEQTPVLIQQEIEWDSYYRRSFWSRYILVMVSRASQLAEKGLVRPAVVYIEEHPWLASLFMKDHDEIAAAICQFDYLQCIHVTAETSNVTKAYPSFGIYNNHRTEPIVSKLIIPGKARASIPEVSDAILADIIRGLDIHAAQQFVRYNGWERGEWTDQSVRRFLETQPPTGQITY